VAVITYHPSSRGKGVERTEFTHAHLLANVLAAEVHNPVHSNDKSLRYANHHSSLLAVYWVSFDTMCTPQLCSVVGGQRAGPRTIGLYAQGRQGVRMRREAADEVQLPGARPYCRPLSRRLFQGFCFLLVILDVTRSLLL